jgi:hypothetical protein
MHKDDYKEYFTRRLIERERERRERERERERGKVVFSMP